MRFWLACGGVTLVVLVGFAIANWYADELPPLPSELVHQDDGPAPEAWRPIPCPVMPSVPELAHEPIEVAPEPFEDPPPFLPGPEPRFSEEVALFLGPVAPRPESSSVRMPYADEEISEFAILLQRAAELRGLPTGTAEESEQPVTWDEHAPTAAPGACTRLRTAR